MVTRILTLLTTRFSWIAILVVVAVVTVPVVSLETGGGPSRTALTSSASSARQPKLDDHTRIVLEVNRAGDDVILALYDEEASCDGVIDQLASRSTLSGSDTAAALQRAKDQHHAAVTPFIDQVIADEREVDDARVLTPSIEQTYLLRIGEVKITALGQDGRPGVLYNVCEAILVDVQQVITAAPAGSHGGGDD